MNSAHNLTKRTCTRCGGSGNYLYNHLHGTMCYGCNGTGVQMVDVKAEARKQAAAAKRTAAAEAKQEIVRAASAKTIETLNALYGPFDINTELGRDQLNLATFRAIGKSIWQVRDELLSQAAA